jgi:hypothetical protein
MVALILTYGTLRTREQLNLILMAKMLPGFGFTGSLANISAYTMRGSDTIILRTKGGASKETIKTSPSFSNVRKNNAEFGGRSAATKKIMQVLYPQKALADYNIAPALNKLLVHVQRLDTTSMFGERHVLLSRNPQLLEGFDLNRDNNFSSIIRHPLSYSLSRDATTATITIPPLIPGINFFVPSKYPLFSLIGTLGVIPDMICKNDCYMPTLNSIGDYLFRQAVTPWLPCSGGSPASSLDFTIDKWPPGNDWSIMLCIGIRFGTIGNDGAPQQVKYAGAAKVLGMG